MTAGDAVQAIEDGVSDLAGDGTATFSRPVWTRDGVNNPVIQPANQTVGLAVTINVCPSGYYYSLIGTSSEAGLCLTNARVQATGADQEVYVQAAVALRTNIVDIVSGSIDWFVAPIGSTNFCPIGTSGPHKNYVTWANPYGSIATLKRIDWACNLVDGYSDTDNIEAEIHATLVGDFVLTNNCASNAWKVLDDLGSKGYDCVSLAGCHMLVSWSLGLDASVNFAYASTDSDCSSMETRTCPGGVHGAESLYVLDSDRVPNNWEACCVANGQWYPGGIAGSFTSAYAVLTNWLSRGATQAWIGSDTNSPYYGQTCVSPGPYPVPSP